MEAKTSFITVFTTIWVIVLTVLIAFVLATGDFSNRDTIIAGVASLACLVFFAAMLVKMGAAERKKRVYYEIN